ncbi:MAG: hypothetical protein A3F83_15305 [Candidatus Glassbacteria bacterium RIFCSPLOWO2_12_FULL_58_11]|uniref:Uncharacterized protein n=2 Tax=Candidatus Glassiibacteriota TaxID=1817805 RepID=A0A1F5YYZ4_9BACT|nr:MAG: hypothetical protein A2Z86_03670 [Candidatus Glassbacteria bacterium GWA2_58_10]OGG05356.1 MAG: hypothetical protein A3F83_15305 [Candidatus Glassbacteria bacterium RIFCSPLOWO2_12_FULL_58_11]
MPITEIPNSGYAYRVTPLDKDQASQDYYRREKKKKSDDKSKSQESSEEKAWKGKGGGRIDLIV